MDPKLPDLNEIKVRPGLTIVRCETIGKLFVRETWQRLEDLPAETRQEIEEFLISPEKRKGDR